MTMKRYLDKLSSDPSLPMNKAESKGPDLRKLLDDAEDAIINALNIIEVVKIEWAAENAWSEYDQSVKDKCGAVLFKIDAVKKNYPAMWPSK